MAVFFIRAERVFFNGQPIYLIKNGFDSCAHWKLRKPAILFDAKTEQPPYLRDLPILIKARKCLDPVDGQPVFDFTISHAFLKGPTIDVIAVHQVWSGVAKHVIIVRDGIASHA